MFNHFYTDKWYRRLLVEVRNSMLYINFSWRFMKNTLNAFTDINSEKYDSVMLSSVWWIASSLFLKQFIIQNFSADR